MTNLYNRVLSWLSLCDIVCNIELMQYSQIIITLKGCHPQKIIITLKGVPRDNKPLIVFKGKPIYTSIANTYQTRNNP